MSKQFDSKHRGIASDGKGGIDQKTCDVPFLVHVAMVNVVVVLQDV